MGPEAPFQHSLCPCHTLAVLVSSPADLEHGLTSALYGSHGTWPADGSPGYLAPCLIIWVLTWTWLQGLGPYSLSWVKEARPQPAGTVLLTTSPMSWGSSWPCCALEDRTGSIHECLQTRLCLQRGDKNSVITQWPEGISKGGLSVLLLPNEKCSANTELKAKPAVSLDVFTEDLSIPIENDALDVPDCWKLRAQGQRILDLPCVLHPP